MRNPASKPYLYLPARYLALVAIVLLMLVLLPLGIWRLSVYSTQVVEQNRLALNENRQWRQYLGSLSSAPLSKYLNNDDKVAFEVDLREVALALQHKPAIQLDGFTVSDSDPIEVDDDLVEPLDVLQVKFEATLKHSPALLDILDQLFYTAGWRVTDVRGCALQRLASTPRLAAACSLDIYHWSWGNTNSMEATSF